MYLSLCVILNISNQSAQTHTERCGTSLSVQMFFLGFFVSLGFAGCNRFINQIRSKMSYSSGWRCVTTLCLAEERLSFSCVCVLKVTMPPSGTWATGLSSASGMLSLTLLWNFPGKSRSHIHFIERLRWRPFQDNRRTVGIADLSEVNDQVCVDPSFPKPKPLCRREYSQEPQTVTEPVKHRRFSDPCGIRND